MKNVKIAREEKTIYVSKNFLITASQFGTPEFNELMDAKRNYPTFEVKEYKIKRNPSKQTYGNLTYEHMKEFIEAYETDEKQRADVLNEYEAVQVIAKTQKAAYVYVKKWFLGKYGDEFKKHQEELEEQKRKEKESFLLYIPAK